jgi:hypothetical protein
MPWGEQAASLPHSAACRMQLREAHRATAYPSEFAHNLFAASCRELQAGSLRSPIRHSSFDICRSPFLLPLNSKFGIRHSTFSSLPDMVCLK